MTNQYEPQTIKPHKLTPKHSIQAILIVLPIFYILFIRSMYQQYGFLVSLERSFVYISLTLLGIFLFCFSMAFNIGLIAQNKRHKLFKTSMTLVMGIVTLLWVGLLYTSSYYKDIPYTEEADYSTYIHEAGHCVVSYALQDGDTYEHQMVTITDYTSNLLGLLFGPGYENSIVAFHSSYDTRDTKEFMNSNDIDKHIQIYLAGHLAEELLLDRGAYEGASGDLAGINSLVIFATDSGLSRYGMITWDMLSKEEQRMVYDDFVSSKTEAVKDLLLQNEDTIRQLADDMMQNQGSLTHEQIIAVIDK